MNILVFSCLLEKESGDAIFGSLKEDWAKVIEVGKHGKGRFEVGLGVGGSLKVIKGSDKVGVVEQKYLPILLALDRKKLVVEQMGYC